MITISDGILTIPEGERFIGFAGDNLHTQKKFLIRNEPHGGWLYRLYLTFDDGSCNYFVLPANVSDEGTWLTWDIAEGHIFKSGLVKAQIKAFSSDKEVYHTTSDVFVAGFSTEEDEAFLNSNSEFLLYEKTLNELYEKMHKASAKMPYVGSNGNWYTYDINTDSYVDSGISSTVAIQNGTVSPEKLDREYWSHLVRVPVIDYSGLDEILTASAESKTIFTVEFSGLSPIKSIVGDGDFLALRNNGNTCLMLINLTNGDKWFYKKNSNSLEQYKIKAEDISDGSVTPEKLVGEYWRHLLRVPVTSYSGLDEMLTASAESKTIFTVEFSGLSPIKSIVGDGDFLALRNNGNTCLMLINLTNGKKWIYRKNSDVLNSCIDSELSDTSTNPVENRAITNALNSIKTLMYAGAYHALEELQEYDFKENIIYRFSLSAALNANTVNYKNDCLGIYTLKSGEGADDTVTPVLRFINLLSGISGEINIATGEYIEHSPEITIDSELSDTSENPVQNKVITETLQGIGEKLTGIEEFLSVY